MPKATLEEMAQACQGAADGEYASIKRYERMFPERPPLTANYAKYQAFEAAAQLIRVLGTYEDDSRKFVSGLVTRHRDGR